MSITPPPSTQSWRGLASEAAQCLRFYTRLPLPRLPWEQDAHAVPDFSRAPRMLPVAGALVGVLGAAGLAVALGLGLPASVAAVFAIGAMVVATGALHEDGLADMADGFWGGRTRERRLEIMSDSRIGSFGATALVLALLLRFAALSALLAQVGAGRTALAIVAAAAIGRVVGLIPLWALPPAKPDGRAAAVGRPTDRTMATAFALTTVMTLLLLTPGFGVLRAILALAVALLAAWPLTRLSRAMLGGHTGDVIGGVTAVAEIVALLVLVARTGS